MKFKSAYSWERCFCCSPGFPTQPSYELVTCSTGEKLARSSSDRLIYAEIQAANEFGTPRAIYERATAGDTRHTIPSELLSYVDTIGMPTDIVGLHNAKLRADSLFNQLPMFVKQAYDNNTYSFANDLFSGKFKDKFDVSKEGVVSLRGKAPDPAPSPAPAPSSAPNSVTINGITYMQQSLDI